MFDRLRNTPKDRGPQLNRKKLEAWQNSRDSSSTGRGVKGGDSQYQYSIRGGGPPPPRPPRDPNYPPERHQNRQSLQPAPPVQAPNQYRSSGYGRPVSSIYSQPSPAAATFAAQQLRLEVPHSDPNEISPPSSPDALSPRDEPNPGDVSPIDEIPDMSQLAVDPRGPKNEARSNIPMMRRERRKNSDAAMNALRETKSRERLKQARPYGHDVRWDPSTGEPTTDSKGRPSQVHPQEYAQGLGTRAGSVSPPQAKQVQGQISFGDRLRRVRQPSADPQPEPAPRPEWRGASGRTTLVAPVNDKKDVAPLKLPRKSSKRAPSGTNVLSPVGSVDSESAASPAPQGLGIHNMGYNRRISSQFPSQPESPASPSIAITNPSANSQTYPSPPLSDDNMAPARDSPTPRGRENQPPQQQQQSLRIPSNDKAIRRKPAGAPGHYPHQSTSSSIYSQPEPHPHPALASAPPPLDTSLDGWTQPPSRFSVTTYATSQQSSTPRESMDISENAPPVPTPPQQFIEQQQQQQSTSAPGPSILDRKRPIVSGYEGARTRDSSPVEPVKISLDSSYYMTSAVSRARQTSSGDNTAKDRNASRLSIASLPDKDKSLPPAPPETLSQTQDRVAQLNAKLQALGNRRINLNTAIKQMTELMPTDNILASAAVIQKREEEKRKVEALRQELAEVERESYELGLKLHRAYKRMDRDAEYEPTTLWVRRVTGS
ncbi:hypothetical protein F5Y13DRAFT_173914 [Hypoxylon sp. FL1857]|nr:hypothetical protein F5Y13DRAFT_173914 [Hypoxylon sp. FL1857]